MPAAARLQSAEPAEPVARAIPGGVAVDTRRPEGRSLMLLLLGRLAAAAPPVVPYRAMTPEEQRAELLELQAAYRALGGAGF